MDSDFVHRENLKHLRELFTRTTDAAECQRIVNLIEEEEAKKAGASQLVEPKAIFTV